MHRIIKALLHLIAVIGLIAITSATPAQAYERVEVVRGEQSYEPVKVVHSEQAQAGPYRLAVGFSTWPLRAMQSLDFTFVPEGGIGGKSGTLTLIAPDGTEQAGPLVRHPRKREVWGLDIHALPDQGRWTLRFAVKGPNGPGTGDVAINVLEQPGPPLGVSWAISSVPVLGLAALIITAWRRTRPQVVRP
ncbi:hypothetical protein GCM10009733_080300 [Nonomuraea maheshkhaliensis]|uniref:Copper resistance protein CopC n=1 Tax=Nonomuraea maheshkhaliensis TaxID=419590 RepID=A0ABN2GGX2_9ACTN